MTRSTDPLPPEPEEDDLSDVGVDPSELFATELPRVRFPSKLPVPKHFLEKYRNRSPMRYGH